MADSDGGPVDKVVLTDPSGLPRHFNGRFADGVTMAMLRRRFADDGQHVWPIEFERAVAEWLRKRSRSRLS
jgi:hypothetical protein